MPTPLIALLVAAAVVGLIVAYRMTRSDDDPGPGLGHGGDEDGDDTIREESR